MTRPMTQSPSAGDETNAKRTRAGKKKAAQSERPRGGVPRAIADLMPEIGGAAFRRFGFVQSSIVTRWAEIAGARHAALSAPESIKFPAGKKAGGTLNLVVASGHAPILQHVIPDLIARVNRFFGYEAVARIAICQGVPPQQTPPRRAESKPDPSPRVPADMGDGLRAIADPELRAVLEAMAGGFALPVNPPRIG